MKRKQENNRLQERVIIIRGLPPRTKLADVFDPLVELAPGPVFRAKLWPNNMAEIEFCTDAAARTVFTLAKKNRLYIKGNCVINFELARSNNELPVTDYKSRVLGLRKMGHRAITVRNETLSAFLKRFSLEVERLEEHPLPLPDSVTVNFASWTDAERAMRLLGKYIPDVSVNYRPDPCEAKDNYADSMTSETAKSLGSESKRQKMTGTTDAGRNTVAGFVFAVLVLFAVLTILLLLEQEFKAREQQQFFWTLAHMGENMRNGDMPMKRGDGSERSKQRG